MGMNMNHLLLRKVYVLAPFAYCSHFDEDVYTVALFFFIPLIKEDAAGLHPFIYVDLQSSSFINRCRNHCFIVVGAKDACLNTSNLNF